MQRFRRDDADDFQALGRLARCPAQIHDSNGSRGDTAIPALIVMGVGAIAMPTLVTAHLNSWHVNRLKFDQRAFARRQQRHF